MSLLAVFALACGGGGNNQPQQAAGGGEGSIITVDGSSTVYPISEAVAEEYKKANPNLPNATIGR